MEVTIPKALLLRAAEALKYKAIMEAGMSVMPELFRKEDTQEWDDAKAIRAIVRAAAAIGEKME